MKLGRIAELAVVEFAADDVIRVRTELVDDASRFWAPRTSVVVSAHATERGSVLLRVEDTGVGIRPDRLAALTKVLHGELDPLRAAQPAVRLGLAVVQCLALAQRLQVVAYTPWVTKAWVDPGFNDDVAIHGAVPGVDVEQVK